MFEKLDPDTQAAFGKAFEQYKRDPQLVNFEMKGRIPTGEGVYGARVNDFYRALAVHDGETIRWFWCGGHQDYERLLKPIQK